LAACFFVFRQLGRISQQIELFYVINSRRYWNKLGGSSAHNEVNVKMKKKLPLFFVTGSSGLGKTYVMTELRRVLPNLDVFDIDNFLECGVTDDSKILNVWLRVARNIAESGRMSIICGTVMPWDVEKCVDYFQFAL
jgi:hypothetical protein